MNNTNLTDPVELLLRATTSRGLRLRGDRLALKQLRRQLMYRRGSDDRFRNLMFKLRARGSEPSASLEILNTAMEIGQIEEALL